jgi:hypothetical protein
MAKLHMHSKVKRRHENTSEQSPVLLDGLAAMYILFVDMHCILWCRTCGYSVRLTACTL